MTIDRAAPATSTTSLAVALGVGSVVPLLIRRRRTLTLEGAAVVVPLAEAA